MSDATGFSGMMILVAIDLLLLLVVIRGQARGLRQAREQGRLLASFGDDLAALCKGMALMGEQCERLEGRISRLGDLQTRRELSDPLERDYELAEKMLRCGEPVELIMSECGLVRSEVELLRRMQERRPDEAAAAGKFAQG